MWLAACVGEEGEGEPSDQELLAQASAVGVTYYDQTKDIIDLYCVTCHYPDSPLAPFSLVNYNEVYAKQSAMIYSLEADSMPAEGSPDLPPAEFNLLLGWLLNGAPSGMGDASPLANAGPDQSVDENLTVILNGSGSVDDLGISSYSWLQISGVPVSLSNTSIVNPQFMSPPVSAVEVLEFELTVTDTAGQTDSDIVQVIVNYLDSFPVANAGANQTVNEGDTVNLDGSSSSDDLGISTFSWTQQSGSTVILSGANTASPNFTAPAINSDETLVFQLTVTDTIGQASSDTVQVEVINDADPVANAGVNQNVIEDDPVTLDGSASSDDLGISTFSWTQQSGSTVTLTGANTATPGFTAPNVPDTSSEILRFELTVIDELGQIDSSTVEIIVNGVSVTDLPPVANAGIDQTADEGEGATLDGSASSDDLGIASYDWQQISGTPVTLSSSTVSNPGFTAPDVLNDEILIFRLTVTDTIGQTSTDEVQVNVLNDDPPIADAGVDQTVNEGDLVSLNGSASSDDKGIVSYDWLQTSGTSVTLSSSNVVNPGFTSPDVLNDEILVFQLTVTDTIGQTSTDEVQVNVLNDDPPIADAGVDQTVNEGSLVNLDGSGSDDVGISSYAWVQISGSNVTISDASIPNPVFTAPAIINTEVLVFQLTVSDTATPAQTSTDTVQVTVNATTAYTYNSDTKTIIDNNCLTACHEPGGSRAISPLRNYSEVIVYGDEIATRVESGNMPKPPNSLTTGEINILLDWIGGGAPEN